MFKRTLLALVAALAALALMIGGEILLALRREYLPTEPAFVIEGTFGDTESPPLRFVVLGDSTAAGLGADTPEDAYPSLLAERLADEGYRVEMTSLGISGARVAELLSEQVPRAVEMDPDLVLVGIGANDVTHLTPLDEVRALMADAIERLKATGATVVVSGVPDMRAAAFYEPLRSVAGWRGSSVTGAIEDAAASKDVVVVPLAAETYKFFADDPEAHNSSDDFHPSSIGYARWATAIFPYLQRALETR
ncbi:MAG: hypothetical protein GEU71_12560 [Actinobacteria bacterium]|nr:hypothetical protein [Actinomycetota bacterium]